MHEPDSSGLVQTHKSHSQQRAWQPDLCLVDLKGKVQIFIFGLFFPPKGKNSNPNCIGVVDFPKAPKAPDSGAEKLGEVSLSDTDSVLGS